MKRMKVLGLCLIAAFAFSVMVAASAQAGKVAHGPIKVESVGEGEAELGNSVANIKCKGHTASSEITGPTTTVNVVAKYQGCEVAGKGIPCSNIGPGEIETKNLQSSLHWVNKGLGEVGVDFWPSTESKPAKPGTGVALLADFTCEGFSRIKVRGSIIGLATPKNEMVEIGKVSFKESLFKNVPESFESGEGVGPEKESLEAEFETLKPGTWVESGQIQVDNTKNHGAFCKPPKKAKPEKCKPNPAMVNTVSGKPEYGRCDKKGGGVAAAIYADSNCQTLSAPGKKGKFGFAPIPQ